VRRSSAFTAIAALPSVQPYLSRLSHVLVPDNAIPGAYDDALTDACYVVHIAGVWPLPVRTPTCHQVTAERKLMGVYRHCILMTTSTTPLCAL
jgi:hypothetical protein